MYTGTSESFNNALQNAYHYRKFKAILKYKNALGTEITEEITQDAIVSGSCKLTASCLNSSDFNVGSVIAQDFQITLYNIDKKYNGCKFQNGTIEPYFGLVVDSGATEWCPLGLFYIDSAGKTYNKTIQLKAVDILLKFEKLIASVDYEGTTTLKTLFERLCSNLGVAYNSNFSNSGYTFKEFHNKTLTYRDILGYIAAAAGGFVKASKSNQIEIVEFEINKNQYVTIDPNITRVECDVDEPIKIDSIGYYVAEGENKLIGDGVYALTIENNELFDALDDLDGLLQALYTKYNGFTYYPVSIEYVGDPRLEPGDTIFLPKTAEGDIYTFIDKHTLTISSFSSLTTPVCNELEKGFLDDYKNYQTPIANTGGGGSTAPIVNPNLLLISQFTRAFLPYYFVNTWSYSAFNSGGVECLCSYYMCEYINRIWLPFQGDMMEGGTYTLSLLMKKTNNYSYTGKYYVCLVPCHNVSSVGKILLNTLARKTNTPVDGNETTILGTIQLTNQWEWHKITFDAPALLPYQNSENITAPGYGYMIALYSDQQGLYTNPESHKNYACFIHRAKLEEGSEVTEWCLGETEKAAISEELDFDGTVKHTVAASVNSLIAEYNFDNLEIAPTTIHYSEHGLTMIQRQKMIGSETTLANQIVFTSQDTGHLNTNAQTEAEFNKYYVTITSGINDKSLKINAPGGLFINGTQYTTE